MGEADFEIYGLIWAAMIGNASLALRAFTHLETLELESMDGACLAATLSAIGFVVAAGAASGRLPEVVGTPASWIGTIGPLHSGSPSHSARRKRVLERGQRPRRCVNRASVPGVTRAQNPRTIGAHVTTPRRQPQETMTDETGRRSPTPSSATIDRRLSSIRDLGRRPSPARA